MKLIKILSATALLTVSMASFAEGGSLWEKKIDQVSNAHLHHGAPTASEMDHSAVQHKRWLFENADNSELDETVSHLPHPQKAHSDHMAADHKRTSTGGNN